MNSFAVLMWLFIAIFVIGMTIYTIVGNRKLNKQRDRIFELLDKLK